jgi:hypothetical protein
MELLSESDPSDPENIAEVPADERRKRLFQTPMRMPAIKPGHPYTSSANFNS